MSTQHMRPQSTAKISQRTSAPYPVAGYIRRADHTPNTGYEEEDKYVLTLHTDSQHHAIVTALRNQYFPATINKLSAHIALFRALPGSRLPTIETDIAAARAQRRSFAIETAAPFLLKQGVGIGVVAPPSKVIYGGLRNRWVDFLSQQDKSFRPHYTIQNKAEPVEAQKAFEEVKKAFPGSRGWVDGSTLWRYDKGYWRHVRDSRFSGADGDGSLATGEGV